MVYYQSFNPVDPNKGNISKILREQSKELNWDGIELMSSLLQMVKTNTT